MSRARFVARISASAGGWGRPEDTMVNGQAAHATDGSGGLGLRMAIGVAAAALMLHCALGWAGPKEDYEQAARANVAGDVVGAMKLARPPAEAGYAPAQALLGYLLESAGMFEESAKYFRMAADQGDTEGAYGLGMAHTLGQGVKQDPAEARRLFELAAAKGHKLSLEVLADAALRGGLGVAPNTRPDAQAIEWIRKAADGNHLASLDFMAKAYRDGSAGKVDLALAQEYEARADKLRFPQGKPRQRRANR